MFDIPSNIFELSISLKGPLFRPPFYRLFIQHIFDGFVFIFLSCSVSGSFESKDPTLSLSDFHTQMFPLLLLFPSLRGLEVCYAEHLINCFPPPLYSHIVLSCHTQSVARKSERVAPDGFSWEACWGGIFGPEDFFFGSIFPIKGVLGWHFAEFSEFRPRRRWAPAGRCIECFPFNFSCLKG